MDTFATRRQLESSPSRNARSYLRFLITELARALPAAGKAQLRELLRGYNDSVSTAEELSAGVSRGAPRATALFPCVFMT